MRWQCDTCGGTKAIYDMAHIEGPKLIGCLTCDGSPHIDWDRAVHTSAYGEITQCVATVGTNWGQTVKRCSQNAHIGALCSRHFSEHPAMFWDVAARYFRHLGPRGLSDSYRRVFRWALEDAGLVIDTPEQEHEAILRAHSCQKPSFVYFVEREGLIKIGTTTNLRSRLKTLGKGGSMPPGMTVGPVKLLASTRGTQVEEREYHQKFRKQRIPKTEWFRPNKALWREIETIQRTHSGILAGLVSGR